MFKRSFIYAAIVGLLLLGCQAVEAAPGPGRLRFGTPTVANPPLPAAQTFYIGPWTVIGFGGVNPCVNENTGWVNVCAGAVSSPAENTSFYLDTLDGTIVNKQGSTKTYNTTRTIAITGPQTITVNTSTGQSTVITMLVDAARAGKYTITSRPAKDTNTVWQMRQMMQRIAYGEEIGIRNGARFNVNGPVAFALRNSATAIAGTYTGSNKVIIRPETGGTAYIGGIQVDGDSSATRIKGLRFQNLTFTNTTYNARMIQFIAGANNIDLWDNSFTGVTGGYGLDRPDGILVNTSAWAISIMRNTITGVGRAINVTGPLGTLANQFDYADPTGIANDIIDNVIVDNSLDSLGLSCITGGTISGNIVYDKLAAVIVGAPYYNPFDATHQAHGDFMQIGMDFCFYGTYAGPTITGNYFMRGNGRNSLPFWTSPPYPTPNSPGTPTTPNPALGLGDAQGYFTSGGESTVSRPYETIWLSPVIKNNVYMGTFANGIGFYPSRDPDVRFNTIISDTSVSNLPFSNAVLGVYAISGTAGVVKNNISAGAVATTIDAGGGSVAVADNVVAAPAAYAATFIAPANARRGKAQFDAAFAPIQGGPAELDPVLHTYAGALCPNGTPNTGAACY